MGLAYDANTVLGIPNTKNEILKVAKKVFGEESEELQQASEESNRPKIHVAKTLEEDANALRVSNFRLPKGQVL